MLKVTVLGHRRAMDDIVAALQHTGVLQIEATAYDLEPEQVAPDDPRLRVLDETSADAHFVRDFLAHYHRNEQPFSAFVSEKFHLERDEYLDLEFDTRSKRLYRECVDMSDQLAAGQREQERLRQLIAALKPWTSMHYEIREWRGTDTTTLFAGTVPASEGPRIRQQLRDEVDIVTVDEYGAVGDRQAWVVIVHHSAAARARSVLATTPFEEVAFPGLTGYPAEEIARAEERLAELEQDERELAESGRRLADEHYERMVALVEALDTRRDQLSVRREFGRTERVFAVSGWVPADDVERLHRALESLSEDIDVSLAEPLPEEEPPVLLKNAAWLKPLEIITDLYGRPLYREIDPTPLLAPFFLAFFGICMGDVGYGAMLLIGAWLMKTRLDIAPGARRFMNLIMMGGAAGMAFGVAFASYFALPVEMLPSFLADLQVLDPLNDLTDFLLFTLVLGAIQVFFGVFVAAYDAFRRGDPSEAVFGQLSIIFLFAMIAAYVVSGQGVLLSVGLVGTMLMQGRAIQRALGDAERVVWDRAVGWIWLAAVVAATLLMGIGQVGFGLGVLAGAMVVGSVVSKTARAATFGLLGGAYAVYGMTGFVGDILSYTRLAALGLSGSLVGLVFNILAGLVWGPVTGLVAVGGFSIVLGVLVAVAAAAVFVVGHVFNVVINLLGAFVHPARLQFVEFFSKFYEAGGRPFAPFEVRSDSLVLEAGSVGSEGGAG
jgi:V/A-type H+-transporting ATPase subunit I